MFITGIETDEVVVIWALATMTAIKASVHTNRATGLFIVFLLILFY